MMILRNEGHLALKNPFTKVNKTPNQSTASTGKCYRGAAQILLFTAKRVCSSKGFNFTDFVSIFKSIKYKDLPFSTVPEGNGVVIVVKLLGIENEAWSHI